MKTIIFILMMVSLNASAMTLPQAKETIAMLSTKQDKTKKDIQDLKEAIYVVSSSWAKRQDN